MELVLSHSKVSRVALVSSKRSVGKLLTLAKSLYTDGLVLGEVCSSQCNGVLDLTLSLMILNQKK